MSTSAREPDASRTAIRWLLVNTAPGGSPVSMDAWRRFRALGAHYLQPAVCLLPERVETTSAIAQVVARVERAGGHARVFPLGALDEVSEREVVAAFSAERSDEYDKVVRSTRAFIAEISLEREHRGPSYAEVEESRVDLRRLQRWLGSIRKRDYFRAPGYDRAADAIASCERLLVEFEAEAYSAEVHPGEENLAGAMWWRRLRTLGSPAGCWLIATLLPLAT